MNANHFPESEEWIAKRVVEGLQRTGLTIAIAESLTGGLLLGALTAIPGASQVVKGGVVAYTNSVKVDVLGVDAGDLARFGAASPRIAAQMAAGVAERCGATVGLATTGIAGPGDHDGVEAGTFWIGWSTDSECSALEQKWGGDRAAVRYGAVHQSLKYATRFSAEAETKG